MAEPMRLQRFLARAGLGYSRRAAEAVIVAGHVAVNGNVVTELGVKIDPDKDLVTFDGKVVTCNTASVTIALNKPCGYLSAMSDTYLPCASELIPLDRYPSLVHIGRLDRNTSGLLLFTTDGLLCHALTHPSAMIEKTYIAHVAGKAAKPALETLRQGVLIHTKKNSYTACPAQVTVMDASRRETVLKITIHEGHYHQVRDMCAAIGHPVRKLERIGEGSILLGDLRPGAWRELSADEAAHLFAAAGLS